jgi:hypothetical protein
MCSVTELDNINWEYVSVQGLRYTQNKLRRYKIIENSAMESIDFVHTAVERIYGGSRQWNKERYPDFMDFFKSVIDSLIYHENKKLNNFKTTPILNPNGKENILDIEVGVEYEFDSLKQQNPEKLVIIKNKYEEFYRKAYDIFKGNKDLETVFQLINKGITKPKEIAEITGLTIRKINNVKKKLRRNLFTLKDIILK